jgi:hypothetical protein
VDQLVDEERRRGSPWLKLEDVYLMVVVGLGLACSLAAALLLTEPGAP